MRLAPPVTNAVLAASDMFDLRVLVNIGGPYECGGWFVKIRSFFWRLCGQRSSPGGRIAAKRHAYA
jgi:hypothetical protein